MGLHEDEDRQYAAEVEAVKAWWRDSRWRYTKRPFTAEQIVAKRGNLKIEYPSSAQAKKLWQTVENNFKVGPCDEWAPCDADILMGDEQTKQASFTYGCLEPTMITQMCQYLDTIYVSGWQSSSTASSTDEPSPDLADYPMVGGE